MVMPFEEIDILQWWKQHKKDFLILSKFAHDVLSFRFLLFLPSQLSVFPEEFSTTGEYR